MPEQPKPQKIDLYDAASVKHKLDSTAAEVGRRGCWPASEGPSAGAGRQAGAARRRPGRGAALRARAPPPAHLCGAARGRGRHRAHGPPPRRQVVLDAGYIEDHLISNVKIALGAAA